MNSSKESHSPSNNNNDIENKIKQHFKETYHFNDKQSTEVLKTTQRSLEEAFQKISEFIQKKDHKNLLIYFHRLKGSFKNIGLDDYAELARKVELTFKNNPDYQLAQDTLNSLQDSFLEFIKHPIE